MVIVGRNYGYGSNNIYKSARLMSRQKIKFMSRLSIKINNLINVKYFINFKYYYHFLGKKWFQRRKMLTKAFHFNILQKYFETFVEQTSLFMKRVEEEVSKEKTDLFPMMNSTTLRIMCGKT